MCNSEFQTHVLPESREQGHKDKIVRATFASNNYYVLTASYDKAVMLWDIRKKRGGAVRTFNGASPV